MEFVILKIWYLTIKNTLVVIVILDEMALRSDTVLARVVKYTLILAGWFVSVALSSG